MNIQITRLVGQEVEALRAMIVKVLPRNNVLRFVTYLAIYFSIIALQLSEIILPRA